MASVFKRTKSQYWTACFTDRDGRQLKRSTKTTNRSEALHIALDLERVERQSRKAEVTTTQLQKVLSDASERITGDSLDVPTVEEYLTDWLKGAGLRISPLTKLLSAGGQNQPGMGG